MYVYDLESEKDAINTEGQREKRKYLPGLLPAE
jgi:hypothetical protein